MPVNNSEFPYFSSKDVAHGEYPGYYTPDVLIPKEKDTILGIVEAKLNYKYRTRNWRSKPKARLRGADLDALVHLCEMEDISVFFHPETNTLWFEKEGLTDIKMMHGWDTGGQVIRLILCLIINSNGGRKNAPSDLILKPFTVADHESGKVGKACMLYIQAVIPTLRVGDSFTVKGGDDENPDAPSFSEYHEILMLFSEYFGRNFTLEKIESEDGMNSITISRHRNTDVPTEPVTIELSHNGHLADHLIMMWITLKMQGVELPPYKIVSPILRGNYHVNAMVESGKWQQLNIRCNISSPQHGMFYTILMDHPQIPEIDE